MSHRTPCIPILTSAILVLGTGSARPDEPDRYRITVESFPAFARSEAKSFTIGRPDGGGKLTLRDEPVLAWTNPVSGTVHGRLYVWTDKGRPEVVAGIFKWFSPHTHQTDEFTSLSLAPLVAVQDGRPLWTPKRPGVELKPLPDAPAPAATPVQRLRQMRELSEGFRAWHTTRAGVERELRVLSRPLYRYESTIPDLVDGALLGIALGTDPEAFLILEAKRTGQALQWQYSLARMNSIKMRATYRGREVWVLETLPWEVVQDPHEPYATFRTESLVKP